ncbi:hypothetical protein Poli38472_001523 [Pythium oligandrum]|uniref:Exosome complex component N-terminal domain-containing protein n=1 Tax=Pythium oligandrum TaxID=41045 RepID=A0A8K1CT14_PYTOL|nr:hypothetical protein Poli38472_001523 [Pythium oligandrum]|eukprot:TMW69367.1 hypothetical protein Poli38472_001523 [Pythium oligandrum]
MAAVVIGSIVVPGQRLSAQEAGVRAGEGTYVRDGAVYASVTGRYAKQNNEMTVKRAGKLVGSSQVLRLGDLVICKVTKVTTRQVLVDIVCVGDAVLQEPFPGTIRLEDVRNHDIDKLVMEELFSPQMLIKAAVLSFGDTRSYFLSTAKPGLGVVRTTQLDDGADVEMS